MHNFSYLSLYLFCYLRLSSLNLLNSSSPIFFALFLIFSMSLITSSISFSSSSSLYQFFLHTLHLQLSLSHTFCTLFWLPAIFFLRNGAYNCCNSFVFQIEIHKEKDNTGVTRYSRCNKTRTRTHSVKSTSFEIRYIITKVPIVRFFCFVNNTIC